MSMNLRVSKKVFRVVVAGDPPRTGKSTMIAAVAAEASREAVFLPSANIPEVLPSVTVSHESFRGHVPITLIDTSSSSPGDAGLVGEQLKNADAIVLTYACDKLDTFDRLRTFWLPWLRQLQLNVPVVVTGCKLDTIGYKEVYLHDLLQEYRQVEFCLECSAHCGSQIPEVFYHIQKAALYPTAQLFDEEFAMTPRCMSALKRIFFLCDRDRDNALSDAELNDFLANCFNTPLQPSELKFIKESLNEDGGDGVNENGVTLEGFLGLPTVLQRGQRLEKTWDILRSFGYNNRIKLADELIPKRAADQSVELTNDAVDYLRKVYKEFTSDQSSAIVLSRELLLFDGGYVRHKEIGLLPEELDDLFATAPESPWDEAPYNDAVQRTEFHGLSLNAFLSELLISHIHRLTDSWALMALLDPSRAVENLVYINYPSDPSSAVHVTRRRRSDRNMQQSERNVYQCFVFGPSRAGKSALLDSFVGKFGRMCPVIFDQIVEEHYVANAGEERYVAGVVGGPEGSKTLVLREIPEDEVGRLLSNKESLAPCDVAVFVYDSSDQSSWRRATELLLDVAHYGRDTGFEVPCIVVAAKIDLNLFPVTRQETTDFTQGLGIEAPIEVTSREGNTSNLFSRIASAAGEPHLRIPGTQESRTCHRLVNSSLLFLTVGAAVVVML